MFDYKRAKADGYTDAEIVQELAPAFKFDAAKAKKDGYTDAELAVHLSAMDEAPADIGIGGQFVSGLKESSTGAILGTEGSKVPPTGIVQGVANMVGGVIGDVPAMVAGTVAGGAAGAPLGPGGALLGAGAAGFAAPALVKGIARHKGLEETALSTGKAAIVGALTAGTGKLLEPVIGKLGALAAEYATITTSSATLEGRLPTKEEFRDYAIMLGGFHMAKGLIDVYKKTGKPPGQVVKEVNDLKAEAELQPDAARQKARQMGFEELFADNKMPTMEITPKESTAESKQLNLFDERPETSNLKISDAIEEAVLQAKKQKKDVFEIVQALEGVAEADKIKIFNKYKNETNAERAMTVDAAFPEAMDNNAELTPMEPSKYPLARRAPLPSHQGVTLSSRLNDKLARDLFLGKRPLELPSEAESFGSIEVKKVYEQKINPDGTIELIERNLFSGAEPRVQNTPAMEAKLAGTEMGLIEKGAGFTQRPTGEIVPEWVVASEERAREKTISKFKDEEPAPIHLRDEVFPEVQDTPEYDYPVQPPMEPSAYEGKNFPRAFENTIKEAQRAKGGTFIGEKTYPEPQTIEEKLLVQNLLNASRGPLRPPEGPKLPPTERPSVPTAELASRPKEFPLSRFEEYSASKPKGTYFYSGIPVNEMWQTVTDLLKKAFMHLNKIPVLGENVSELLKAKENLAKAASTASKDIHKILAPITLDKSANRVANIIREHLGIANRAFHVAVEQLSEIKKEFARAGDEISIAWMKAMERGETPLNDFGNLSKQIRPMFDKIWNELESLNETAKLEFVSNYFPRVFKVLSHDALKIELDNWWMKREFEGRGDFKKARVFPTLEVALNWKDSTGKPILELLTTNPVDMAVYRIKEAEKYLAAVRTSQQLVKEGILKKVVAKDDKLGIEVIDRYGKKTIERPPSNWRMISVGGKRYYTPADVARIFDNYASPGLQRNPTFKLMLGAGNLLNSMQLGFGLFHVGFTSMEAITSEIARGIKELSYGHGIRGVKAILGAPMAPITTAILGQKGINEYLRRGSENSDIGKLVDAVVKGGGSPMTEAIYRTQITEKMIEAFKHWNLIGGIVRLPFAGAEMISKPIMERLVPAQKMGVALRLLSTEMEGLKGKSPEDVHNAIVKVWDSVDNRMGQLIYDNLFWNRTVKDLALLSVRSVGWNLGTFREVGGGMKDFLKAGKSVASGHTPEMTSRMSYVLALPLTVGFAGALTQYLATGQGPQELKDYFFPKVGGLDEFGREKRISIPSYMKDVFHVARHPIGTITSKAHPMIGLVGDMLENKDFYGQQVRNPRDPMMQQLLQLAMFTGKSFEPFSLRGYRKETGTTADKVAPFFGITSAPAYISKTKAEDMATEFLKERMPDVALTETEVAQRRIKKEILSYQQRRLPIPEELRQRAKILTFRQLSGIGKMARLSGFKNAFNHLTLIEALDVWEVSSEIEKKQVANLLGNKIVRASKDRTLTPELMKRIKANIRRT